MPVTIDTPESAPEAGGAGDGDATAKALIVAVLLLAERIADITPIIIENAAATRDLAARIDRLFADGGASAKPAPEIYGFADKYDFAKEKPEPTEDDKAKSSSLPVYITGPSPLPVHDDVVYGAIGLMRLQLVTQLGKLTSIPIPGQDKDKEKKEEKGPDFGRIWAEALTSTLRGLILSGNIGGLATGVGQAVGKTTGAGLEAAGVGATGAGLEAAAAGAIAEKILGTITGPIDAIVNKFSSVIGPLAIISATLNSTTAGFQILGKVVGILGATLGSIFLPITIAMGAALLEITDVIWSQLEPGLDDWIDSMLGLIPLFVTFGAALIASTSALVGFALWLLKKEQANNPLTDEEQDKAARKPLEDIQAGLDRSSDALAAVSGGLVAREETGGGPSSKVTDILKELRLSIGPKAAFTGIADVGKQIQLAALNQTPFEAQMLRLVSSLLSHFERRAALRGRPDAPYRARGETGAGDYEGGYGEGGGGDFGGAP